MRKFNVPESFVGLLYEDGAFARLLQPGKHRLQALPFSLVQRTVALVDLRERSLTIKLMLKHCNAIDIEEQFRQLHEKAEQELREIAGDSDMRAQYSVDLRYRGPNRLSCDARFRRGDEMGYFQHGSTIILFASANFRCANRVRDGQRIQMGQPLLRRT